MDGVSHFDFKFYLDLVFFKKSDQVYRKISNIYSKKLALIVCSFCVENVPIVFFIKLVKLTNRKKLKHFII